MDRKPTVLHVSTWKVPCGIATYCENLVLSLERIGWNNEIAQLHPHEWPTCLPQEIDHWRDQIVKQAESADLVHVQHEHGLFGNAVSNGFAVKRYGSLLKELHRIKKPVVTTFHTDVCTNPKRGLSGKLKRIRLTARWKKHVTGYFGAGPGKNHAIVHARDTRKSMVKHSFPADAVHVLPHACLPPRNITLSQADAKQQLGLPRISKIISIFGFVGRYKGHDLAIEALEKLPQKYHLAIVGGAHPESREEFLDEILTNIPEKLKSRVHITGWVDRATADLYFAATDVCLAPYRGNTLLSGSGAITWALSSGRPVIASKIEAFQHVNRIGDCMFMVSPDNTNELAWAVEKVVADRPLRERLVENARKFTEEYSWENSLSKLLGVYRQCAPELATHCELPTMKPDQEIVSYDWKKAS
ncbi:MAG: glycosyltransferase family 4 protein [Planctomycetaceae bacterium]|nr:glycosyltransferase family 4 protein [Planctomycetaceae bacterium]